MYCSYCGAKIEETDVFCGKCGWKCDDSEYEITEKKPIKLINSKMENNASLETEISKTKKKSFIIALSAILFIAIVVLLVAKNMKQKEPAKDRNAVEEDSYSNSMTAESGEEVKSSDFDWKREYKSILEKGGAGYCVYDVDDDGIPELFVERGDSMATLEYSMYKVDNQNNAIIELETGIGGHEAICGYEEENAILVSGGQMGDEWIYKLSLKDKKLIKTVLFEGHVENYHDLSYLPIFDISNPSGFEFWEGNPAENNKEVIEKGKYIIEEDTYVDSQAMDKYFGGGLESMMTNETYLFSGKYESVNGGKAFEMNMYTDVVDPEAGDEIGNFNFVSGGSSNGLIIYYTNQRFEAISNESTGIIMIPRIENGELLIVIEGAGDYDGDYRMISQFLS